MTKSNTARTINADAKAVQAFANLLPALAAVFKDAEKAKDTSKARVGAALVAKVGSKTKRINTTGGAAEYAHACKDKVNAILARIAPTENNGTFDALDALCIDASTSAKLDKLIDHADTVIDGHKRIKLAQEAQAKAPKLELVASK
jgi:hypothetical protein